MLHYCKKCGRIILDSETCDCCKSHTYPVPEKFWLDGLDFLISNEQKKLLREELVKTSPEFDQELFDHRDEILAKQSAEFNAKIEHGKTVLEGRNKSNQFGVECPYCHATNVKKITITSKAVHTAVFGVFSISRNSKQWHCNQCNSDF